MCAKLNDIYLPREAEIVERIQEAPTIFRLRLRFTDPIIQERYVFQPGQFNMLYLYGVGEVAISIVSDPENNELYDHAIRVVGRVTKGLALLQTGARMGVRGPFGQGWPMQKARQKDVVIVSGGLGCAPVVSAINYIVQRRAEYGHLRIMQSVKHSDDFIFRERYQQWRQLPDTEIYIAADKVVKDWPWQIGRVTDTIKLLDIDAHNTVAMLCGPEIMMRVAAEELIKKNVAEQNIYLSMERNMQCSVGHCGHCQYGGWFICKNGPVHAYSALQELLGVAGF
jgi:NAD(P)H-flavin reductase